MILNLLIDYYYSDESGDSGNRNRNEVEFYFKKLLDQGNIVYELDDEGEIKGFIEFYLVTKEQSERYINESDFLPLDEDIVSGEICYIYDLWINPKHRNNGGFKLIRRLKNKAEEIHGKKAEVIIGKNWKGRKMPGKYKLFNGGG